MTTRESNAGACCFSHPPQCKPHTFGYNETDFLLDGQPIQLFSGEMHYFRVPHQYWRDRFRKARAMGLNAVCTYMAWNLHEPQPGVFDFSEMLDVAAYVRQAQEEGLLVLLRPGPYICSEWDFGGLPSWLLKVPDIKVRCSDLRYLQAATRWIARVGDELAALSCTRGGPIVMVQIENEYGAFGNDKAYLEVLRQATRDAGFIDVPLFTCDWAIPHHLNAGGVDGCLTVANFGSNARQQIEELRRLRPGQPAMCGEFWCGWFSAWGGLRGGGSNPEQAVAELQSLIKTNASFNLYMFHGGTSFGFMSGANDDNNGYAPDVSSYDFQAPLDEAGRPTEKYFAFRDLLARFQPHGTTLPSVPVSAAPIAIAEFELMESVSLLEKLPLPALSAQPQTMEALGQSQGLMLYRTSIAGLGAGELKIVDVHDYATIFLNGCRIGTLDRRLRESVLSLSVVPEDIAQLDILVDTTGRVNFGPRMLDRKGITDRVEYKGLTLMNWEMTSLPLDAPHRASLSFTPEEKVGPAVHRGFFSVSEPGDTFLDMREWSRGMVWVNDHALGRFWQVGPQQTLYVPGVWLYADRNEIVVFDLESNGRRPLQGLAAPILG